jgi:starch phosphorylase
LRFLQEYFLVRCSLADIVARFRRRGNDWAALPDKVAIQLNDTHPAMAVPELMRILLDEAKLGWDQAWDLTVRTLAYTNHTLLPEALEKWSVELFEALLPRHLEVVYEINRRFLADVQSKYPGDTARLARVNLIEEGTDRKVRMANLAIVGTHSTNGVAAIHSELLRTKTVPDFAELFPDRFNNKTNGITPRRWLLLANPDLAKLITDTVGHNWETDCSLLCKIDPLAFDTGFQGKFLAAKRGAKTRFVDWIKTTAGIHLDPDTLFDVQIKRIHEYKRQLLNAVQVVVWYNRLLANPSLAVPPRTVLFAGKAAPAYHLAKVIIKLITSIGRVVNSDPAMRGKLQVEFLPNYSCTLAEYLIPAADVSEQISTAGYEASGTSNMKFMMNGALTVGTRDGANIEIAQEAGEENAFMFGLTTDQVLGSRGWYNPQWHYENEPETRAALDMIFNNHFSADEPGIFEPIRETLLTKGDYYMHLADLTGYVETQAKVAALYQNPQAWAEKAIHNVARSGKFSSDRTIEQYSHEIWNVQPCQVG